MDKKLIYLTVDQDEADETRVEKVSFVDSPAIQRGWMAFNGQQRFKVQSEDRRIVSGALMVAGLPIYRRDESGEYYVSFTASAIQAIVYKFMKENRTKEVNEMHETDVDGVFLFESFIQRNPLKFRDLGPFIRLSPWVLQSSFLYSSE